MSLLDFTSRERIVSVGGRRFVCRPPTVHTVALFLRLFGLQAAALCEAAARGIELTERDIIEQLVSEGSVASTVSVLETCVTTDGTDLWSDAANNITLLRALANVTVSLTDPKRIVEATGLDRALDSPLSKSEGPTIAEDHDADSVCFVAAHFGSSPTEVVRWPYLAFLAAGEHLSRLAASRGDRRDASGLRSTEVPGVPLEGIVFERGV